MVDIRELDIVRVVKLLKTDRHFDGTEEISRAPEVGDSGTVVHIAGSDDLGFAYTVENSDENGLAIWIADFEREELEVLTKINDNVYLNFEFSFEPQQIDQEGHIKCFRCRKSYDTTFLKTPLYNKIIAYPLSFFFIPAADFSATVKCCPKCSRIIDAKLFIYIAIFLIVIYAIFLLIVR